MKNKFAVILFLFCVSAKATVLNDLTLTPGATRTVTKQELCTTSTKLVRDVPYLLKKQVFANYHIDGNHTGSCKNPSFFTKDEGCEIDHLISLELGGSNDIKNLWPEPYFGRCNAHEKDALENRLHSMICKDQISIKQAQTEISTNWITAYTKYVDAKGCK